MQTHHNFKSKISYWRALPNDHILTHCKTDTNLLLQKWTQPKDWPLNINDWYGTIAYSFVYKIGQVFANISQYGLPFTIWTELIVIDGIMDKHMYKTVLQDIMEASADNLPAKYVLQHDNDPKHTSKVVKD